jgi:hypothetical protein
MNVHEKAINASKSSSGSEIQSSVFLDKEQLRVLLNLPSTRMVDELMRRKKIPFLRLGHKTVRFEWKKVQAALEKFERKAVGQK